MASSLETVSGCEGEELEDLPPELLSELRNVNLRDTKEFDRDNIVIAEWLKDCESTFLWHIQNKRGERSELIIQKTLEKIEELKIDEPEMTLANFILLLKLVLEYYIIDDMENSWLSMKTFEDEFKKLAVSESSECECKGFELSLHHLMSATKAQLLMVVGEEQQSKDLAKEIISVKMMTANEQAAVWAMKSRFFLYSGYENGESVGVESAKKAVELDPENPEWEFLLARLLRQQRKEVPFGDEVPREELIILERVIAKKKRVKYLIYLAQVYMECGKKAFHKHRSTPDFFRSKLHQTIEGMHRKALDLYKEALGVQPNSPSVLRRIGYGIMNLPAKVADYDLALECLLKSLDISNSLITMHMLGTFYHRYRKDNKKALEYFEKTAHEECHAGLCDMIRMKFMLDPEYDPRKDLEWGLSWKQKQKNRSLLLIQLGAYYLFLKRDFLKSIEYFNQVLEEDRDTPHMKTFKSFFLRMFEPIDILQYIVNEAMIFMQQNKPSSTDQEDNNFINIENLLCKIIEAHPEFLDSSPDPNLIDSLLQKSKLNMDMEKNMHGKSSNRGNFRNSNRGSFEFREQGRGGFNWNQRGKGYRGAGGRGNWHQGGTQDNLERRGRFSVENQRDKRGEDCGERRQQTSSFQKNYRRFRNDSSGDEHCSRQNNSAKPKSPPENWRNH